MASTWDHDTIRRIAITAVFSDDYLFEKVVLKGGNALAIVLGISGRTSLDLDFSIENDFENPDEAARRLREALERRFAEVGLVVFDFSFSSRPHKARDGAVRWGGYAVEFKLLDSKRFEEIGDNKQARGREALVIGPAQQRKFSIELSKYEYTKGKLAKELDHYDIFVYAPEMIALEKMRAICQQMPEYVLNRTPTARARDFFDIHLIIMVTRIDLSSAENRKLAANIFEAKEVPLYLLRSIANQREFHRPDWDSVRASVSQEGLESFDYYFDFVLKQVDLLKPLWCEDSPV
jgi:Nucleotidyl transferase AbiEii toxin, Type IV TA system